MEVIYELFCHVDINNRRSRPRLFLFFLYPIMKYVGVIHNAMVLK